MFKLVSTELGPNYQVDDGFIASLSLVGLLNETKAEIKTKNWFRKYLGVTKKQSLYFTDNGRTSLFLLLKSLNLDTDTEVLIQGFSCVVLPNSVWAAGLKPVLVDASEENFNFDIKDLEKKITSKSKVLVLQYTFGVIPDLQKIIEICRKHNLILVEDVAHSLGCSAKINGKNFKIGTIGQAAFFSFGRDKIISTTRGGFAYINPDPVFKSPVNLTKWESRMISEYENLPKMPFKYMFQTLIYPVLVAWFIRPLYHFYLGKVILYLARKFKFIGEIYTQSETIGTSKVETASEFPKKLFPLLSHQIEKISEFNQHRIEICKIYSKSLNLPNYGNQPLLRYPVDLKTFSKNYQQLYPKIIHKLRENGILIGQWYTSLFMQPHMDYVNKFNLKKGVLKSAFSLSDKRVINLPTNIYVSPKDAELICQILKNTTA